MTVGVVGSVYGPVDQFDHPVASFLAVGLAEGLDVPVSVQVESSTGDADAVVTCRWPVSTGQHGSTE